jgi:hypothetical protein
MNQEPTHSPRDPNEVLRMPVSAGEFLDKWTIVRIKSQRLGDPQKQRNVQKELALLEQFRPLAWDENSLLKPLLQQLQEVNERLWDVEDALRLCEQHQDFGSHFIDLARSVYRFNDQRSLLKQRINELLGSALVEVKSYGNPKVSSEANAS